MADQIDPNVYSLKVLLSLSSGEAFKDIDNLEDKARDLELAIGAAAQKSLDVINSSADGLKVALSGVSTQLNSIGASSAQIDTSLIDAVESANKQLEASDTLADNATASIKKLDETLSINEQITAVQKEQEELNKGFIEDLTKIIQAIDRKNGGHSEQNQLMDETGEKFADHSTKASDIGLSVNDISKAWFSVVTYLRWAERALLDLDKASEHFVTTNNRLYSSQENLAILARGLTAELGVSLETALDVTKALINVKTPRDQLEKYGKALAQANRYLGVSVGALAEVSRMNRLAGGDFASFERQVLGAAEAMRRFGVNSSDIESIMSTSSRSALSLRLVLGGTVKDLEKFNEAQMALTGFTGIPVEDINKFADALQDLPTKATLESYAGMQVDGEKMFEFYRRLSQGLDDAGMSMEKFDEMAKAGDTNGIIAMRDVLEGFGISLNQLKAINDIDKEALRLNIPLDDMDGFNKLMKDGKKTIDPYTESMQTFTAQWRKLQAALAPLGSVLLWVLDGLSIILEHVTWFTSGLAKAASQVIEFVNALEDSGPAWGAFIRSMKVVVAFVAIGIGLFALLATAVITLGGGFTFLASLAGAAITAITAGIGGLVTVFTTSLTAIFSGIGAGLAALGRAIQPVILPLLGLSAALLITAAASYVFAMAVVMIADRGWEAIGMAFAFVGVIGLLGLVLVGLAFLAQGPIALGLLAIGATFLMIGAAAALAGWGLDMAASGLIKIAGVASAETALNLVMLGGSLIALSTAAIIAVPGIAALGLATLMLIPAIAGLSLVGRMMAQFDAEGFEGQSSSIHRGMTSLRYAGVEGIQAAALLTVAGGVLVGSGIALGLGALSIGAATFALGPAVAMLTPLIASLAASAPSMLLSSNELYVSGVILFAASSQYVGAGVELLAGAVMLIVASAELVVAGGVMWLASFSISSGVVALTSSIGLLSLLSGPLAYGFSRFLAVSQIAAASGNALKGSADLYVAAGDGFNKAFAMFDALTVKLANINAVISDISKFDMSGIFGVITSLMMAAPALSVAVDQFADPAYRLISVLDELDTSLAKMSSSKYDLGVDRLVSAMAEYRDAVQPDTIKTVQMFTDNEESEVAVPEDMAVPDSIDSLTELLDAIAKKFSGGDLSKIVTLLETYLPDLMGSKPGLGGW